MAYSAKVGSFNIDTTKTAGQTQAITGVGFTPKIVMFWWGGSAVAGDTVAGGDLRYGFGAVTGAASRFYISAIALDAQTASNNYCESGSDACIAI
jgi:hypothetical protein